MAEPLISEPTLERLTMDRLSTGEQGTFGFLEAKGFQYCTGELPWKKNEADVSCIPRGIYKVVWTLSKRFKRYTYEVIGVVGRTGVRIHPANFMGDKDLGYKSELNGCIALGDKYGTLAGQKALLSSKDAVKRFEEAMKGLAFELEIRE